MRMGLVVRQVDSHLAEHLREYPDALPVAHPAALAEFRPELHWQGGVLVRYRGDEFGRLELLARQLEVNRCYAEARLALVRAGELELDAEEAELTLQRALGILPGREDLRFLELASFHEFAPDYMTSSPQRFLHGVALIEREFGMAAAFGYGFLLLAGVRSADDLGKYGRRLDEAFGQVTGRSGVGQLLDRGGTGLRRLKGSERIELIRQVLSALRYQPKTRSGVVFLLTQVVDGFLGLRPGGVGNSFGLAVFDAMMLARLGFRVGLLVRDDRFYVSAATAGNDIELWDPLEPEARVPVGAVRRLSTADVFVVGYVRLARGYATTKAYGHVGRVARWLLEMKPDLPEAYELLGVASVGLGRPKEGVEYCARSLTANPKQPEAWLVQGNGYAMLGRWPEAISSYKKAIGLRVGYAESYNNLGLALDRNGEHERAVGAFREAIRINPEYVEAWYNLGNSYFEHEHYEPAVDAYRNAVRFRPSFAGAHYNMGQAFYRKGDKRRALEAYLAAVEANPKHAGAWHNLGIVYRDLGEPDRAVEALERAVSLNPALLR